MRARISGDSFFGPDRPNHEASTSSGYPLSTKVGTSGKTRRRVCEVIASGTRAPLRTCSPTVVTGKNIAGTWPAMTSATAAPIRHMLHGEAGQALEIFAADVAEPAAIGGRVGKLLRARLGNEIGERLHPQLRIDREHVR